MLDPATRVRYLTWLLRFGGCVLTVAFLAVLMPVEWMAASHQALGLGEFPRQPIVDYLARSVSALYGFHGILLFVVATDPVKYRAIVTYLVAMTIGFGVIMIGIDLHAGLPLWWTAVEGPSLLVLGTVIGLLNRR